MKSLRLDVFSDEGTKSGLKLRQYLRDSQEQSIPKAEKIDQFNELERSMLKEKYLNPFTDFGFKKLFGEELNKDLLIDFLNEILIDEKGKIREVTFLKTERLGAGEPDRKAIFDLYCENEAGEKFIVELQKAKQNFFKDRSVFYATFPIRDQAETGDWNFQLKAVYTIGILDFVFDEDKHEKDKYYYKVKLLDTDTKKVFFDKLTFIYLEMPKFNKKEALSTSSI